MRIRESYRRVSGRQIGRGVGLVSLLLGLWFGNPLSGEEVIPRELEKEERLRAAYPGVLTGTPRKMEGRVVVGLRGGMEATLSYEGKRSYQDRLDAPSLVEMLHDSYPKNLDFEVWPENLDPGRYRNEALMRATYGDSEAEVREGLVPVEFLGRKVLFQSRNGAAEALAKVGRDLAELVQADPSLRPYFERLGGTFNWRTIAGTERLSSHSFGVSIDLNPALGGYWKWSQPTPARLGTMKRRRAYPMAIVRVFERHGFIWGGKWYHFDLMHFEYRPEFFQ